MSIAANPPERPLQCGPACGDPGPITLRLRRFDARIAATAPLMEKGDSATTSLTDGRNFSRLRVKQNARSSSSSPNSTAKRSTAGCFATRLDRNDSKASPEFPARTAISPSPPVRFAAWSARMRLISEEAADFRGGGIWIRGDRMSGRIAIAAVTARQRHGFQIDEHNRRLATGRGQRSYRKIREDGGKSLILESFGAS